jgi:uncharacterized protein YjlB
MDTSYKTNANINPKPEIISQSLKDDGTFPNNPGHPLVLYKKAIRITGNRGAETIEDVFHSNRWGGSWRNGVYPFHHYHSTAHEVLGVYKGEARVQFGGEKGPILAVASGDVVIIPAGVAHKNINSSTDFRVVGAYPPGQTWDMNYGKAGERPAADKNIASVPDPKADPVYGSTGPLLDLWKA